MKFVISFLLLLITGTSATAQDITGDWYGILNVQGTQLDVVFHIAETEEGYATTMDSPKQNAYGIPIDSTSFNNNTLLLKAPNAGGMTYEGILKNSGINGTFKQGGMQLPLDLSRAKPISTSEEVNRPQEPKRPFPYVEEEVSFENIEESVTLAGTLTLPAKEGTFPAVVLITGSGPQDRNEEILGHKPFLVLSDYLTRNGIAVLRYDDRGVGKSTGKFAGATTANFANDARAAVEFLKNRKEIDSEKIGIIGHSEGGMIAPMLAANDKDISFLVLLAAPGVGGDKILLSQKEKLERKSGVPERVLQQSQEIFRGAYDIILEMEPGEQMYTAVFNHFKAKFGPEVKEETITQISKQLVDPWTVAFVKHDPAVALKKIEVPVLAINGKNDFQVISEINLPAIEKALEEAGNNNLTIKNYDKLNHLFQESESGLSTEYEEIEQTMAPEVLKDVTTWILETIQKRD
ncbi:alpha/beta hydrolase family protein [Salinimicrobium sp. GXAS 041]|uniref:alpha/beta hydrolase family protein n=1 Tax=Salinimicrobium sp. GXAS 041 TaxID=3400806 RepID=UPI003C76864C